MSKQTERNKDTILRHIYVSDTASIKDICDSTYLTRSQTQRAIRYLLDDSMIKVYKTEEIRGNLPDRKIYSLTSEGLQIVRAEDLEESQKAKNSEEIKKLKEEIISLNEKIRQYKEDLDRLDDYTKQLNKASKNRIERLEKEVIED